MHAGGRVESPGGCPRIRRSASASRRQNGGGRSERCENNRRQLPVPIEAGVNEKGTISAAGYRDDSEPTPTQSDEER